jgi:hypothetical protein
MSAKIMSEGIVRFLSILFGAQAVDASLYLGLYTNAIEPPVGYILDDLDELSIANGYSRKRLLRGGWTIANGFATYAVQTFLANGGNWGIVAGYFLATTMDNSGKLIAVEHFDDPFTIVDGKGLKINPAITAS